MAKILWTPTRGTQVTLGDDSVKWNIIIEQLTGQAEEQVDDLAFSTYPFRVTRGNVKGDFVFQAAKSHASYLAAFNFFKAERARMNAQGTLVWNQVGAVLPMAGAVLRSVNLILPDGVRWHLRYTFGITSIV